MIKVMNNIQSYRKPMYNMRVFALLGLSILCASPIMAQNKHSIQRHGINKVSKEYPSKDVSGIVTDATTGKPLVGVHVLAYGNSKYAAMTGDDGSYTIRVPEFITSLTMSVEGFNLSQCAINGRSKDVNASLYSDAFTSNYNDKTTATSNKTAAQFDNNADLSIDKQIQSNLGADVHTIMRSGQPGIGGVMFMNGLNSLKINAQPLIVLDGVLMDMQYDRTMLHDGYYNNLLTNINVDDIEKIDVLKNGTAIYGANGANGVILIDTKRNKSMATKIDFSLSGSYELIPKLPDMMGASDYRTYVSELLGSTGTDLSNYKFLESDPSYYYYNTYHNNTDWTKETYKNTFLQNYGISVQGGDEVASYSLSVGYTDANSNLKDNDYTRFNIRLNSDIVLSSRTTIRFDALFSDVNRDLRDDGVSSDVTKGTITSPGFLSLIKAPFLSPYTYDTKGHLSSFLADADDYLDQVLGTDASLANPSSLLSYGEAQNKNAFGNRMVNLAITPKYKINGNLSLSEHFSYSLTNTNENYYIPVSGVPLFVVENVGTVSNVAESQAARQNIFYSDTRLDWKKLSGANSFYVFGGLRYVNSLYSLNRMAGYNTGNDKTPNMSTSLLYKKITGVDDKSKTFTYYGTADYNYKEKYFLSGGVSMEASSRFGQDVKDGIKLFNVPWGLFPSVQGAWVMSSEPWFKSNDIVNSLKLNLGYDLSGNDDLDYTASKTYFTATKILSAVDGLSIANIGNTTLQWETTKRLTGGLNMNMLHDRLSVQANVFSSHTNNLVTLKELAYVSGLDKNWSNDGSLKNSGYDLSLNGKVLNLKNLKFEMGFSVAHYKNEITSLPDNNASFSTTIYGANVLTQVGSPVGVFYGYKTNGVYSTTDAAEKDGYYMVSSTGAKEYFSAGDVKFVDKDNNKVINDNDRCIIGDPNPKYYGNIFAHLNYKRVGLNVVFNYSVGNDVYNYERSILESGSYFYNQTTALKNRWVYEGQETNVPKISYLDEMGNSRFSDRWIEDGSYLRLKTVTLSYNLPFHSTYLQSITLWCSAENLLTFTKYLGSDPEFSLSNDVLSQGIDRGLLSQGRNFSVGVKINL